MIMTIIIIIIIILSASRWIFKNSITNFVQKIE